jgi:ABC-type transport system involved in multi-copper enzyme maturation permease subunit
MTAGTLERAVGQAERGGGLGPLIRAEWTKFRSVRGWVIGMVVAAVLMDLVGLLGAASSTNSCQRGTGAACLPSIPTGPGGEAVSDSYYLVGRPLAGHGSLTVRVAAMTGRESDGVARAQPGQGPAQSMARGLVPWSKAGIIITASTRQGAAYAAMMVTGGHGVRLQDDYVNDVPGLAGAVTAASPRWLRLTRAGDTVTGYDSADGRHWQLVGTVRLTGLPATVQAGLFAASPLRTVVTPFFGGAAIQGGPTMATGVFDHVRLAGGSAATGRWTGQAIGADGPALALAPAAQLDGYHQAGGRFTVTGSGDIAPIVAGPGSGVPTATISDHLAGAFAGLLVIVIIAAMFMTAEYRRGLIRTTLAASPRRGQVLAAKAIVIGSAAFVTGLVAAVIAVTVGVRLSRDGGSYVLPVPWLTEVRAVAGTAGILAVAAVLALAAGTLLRRSAVAITVVIAGIVLPHILATGGVLPAGAVGWLLRVTPAAAFAIQQSVPRYPQVTAPYPPIAGYYPLSPWAGFGVLCAFTAATLGLAAWLLHRRDA